MKKNKLKTLKDCYEWTDEGKEILFESNIKEAAKEWIKDREQQLLDLKDTLRDNVCFPYNYQIIANGLQSQIHIFKYFFNLEEEED